MKLHVHIYVIYTYIYRILNFTRKRSNKTLNTKYCKSEKYSLLFGGQEIASIDKCSLDKTTKET